MRAQQWLFPIVFILTLMTTAVPAEAVYDPARGVWLQRDPHGTGLLTQGSLVWGGGSAPVDPGMFDSRTHYVDGLNLYATFMSSPIEHIDPFGLSSDPFQDEIDAIIGEHLYTGFTALGPAQERARLGALQIQQYTRLAHAWDELIFDRDAGILMGMVVGPFFSTLCFEEGTPVMLSDGSTERIERIDLGSAVRTADDPLASTLSRGTADADPDAHGRIDAAAWRRVDLRLEDPQRGTIHVSLLRPIEWFRATGVEEGGVFALNLPEMAIRGIAMVLAIGPCPAIEPLPLGGQLVTGTFVTERAEVVRVWLEDASEPIGTTPSHPFYSEDRAGWVAAGELRQGESVRTLAGSAKVERIEPAGEPATVYNFEVHRSHTYYVGAAQVWVHNECTLVSRIGRDSRLVREAQTAGRAVQRSLDDLQLQLVRGNMNPGIGTKAAGFGNIMYARARDGARQFFRTKDDAVEILAKAYKGNEDRVFRLLRELYGN